MSMKTSNKITIFAIIALFSFSSAFCSCGNPKKEIRKAAQNYLDAMANYRIDDAVPFCTVETQEGVIETGRNLMKKVKESYIKSDTPAKVKITRTEITSDTTATVFYHKTTPLKNQYGEVNLVLRNGKWLVHIVMLNQKSKKENNEPEISKDTINGIPVIGIIKNPDTTSDK